MPIICAANCGEQLRVGKDASGKPAYETKCAYCHTPVLSPEQIMAEQGELLRPPTAKRGFAKSNKRPGARIGWVFDNLANNDVPLVWTDTGLRPSEEL